ncbi:fructose-bisphosphate aldolase, class II [Marininema mesophilum]|uniref:Fructose-bisphosphate aldolase, class II n=1 Tax=Marininema mesophilum TaxID=1048340 RepID=A0A1H2T8N4_9BACL|nr:class II fructose-1,6-bisphosphate aldolase [Marininema mesophilum]SDW40190.1 fructose-bisphosphate aldolase, class II [Marininema mesophilum]
MPLVPMTAFLPRAKKEGFAVGQFNMNNLEFVQGIAAAAKEEQSPFIFGVSEGAMRYMGIDYVVAMAEIAAKESGVPVALHLDHGSNFDVVMKCIQAGFSSVMFDGSHHPYEENIVLTKEVVKAAHAVGVSVEGELGTIGGVEDDLVVEEADAAMAKPDEAIRFWEETKVDALAIAVGTAHGMYKGEPKIHFDIIDEVAKQVDAPIVLHGGSGVPDQAIQESIRLGVGKINVNTESQVSCTAMIREKLGNDPSMIDPRKYLGPGRDAIQQTVQGKMRLFGSSGKA